MAVTLNSRALAHARRLIEEGRVVLDGRDEWPVDRASTDRETRFIRDRGLEEYQRWYLGVDEREPPDSRARYKVPYGDFENVHRCGLLWAERNAAQYRSEDIEAAVIELQGLLERPG